MHLLSCKSPQRVFNKYSGEYVWVPCGHCSICKNRRASHYTQLLERERLQHRFCFFVTLTYSNDNVPCITQGDFIERKERPLDFVSNRPKDNICISFNTLFPEDKFIPQATMNVMSHVDEDSYSEVDLEFFDNWIQYGGLPYASKRDAQLFLKRLNKYANEHYTYQFKNFRYFLVSELGSTTFRPHFHAIFFVDNPRLAEGFKDCISSSWKYGIIDCQSVENSACSYVSQYLNKSPDLPYVYKNKLLRPFFLCSRNPFIGTFSECPENDEEIVRNSVVTTYIRKSANSTEFNAVPLQQSYQNRLFPKCPSYCSVSDFVRTQLYTIFRRFSGQNLQSFLSDVYDYYVCDCLHTEFWYFLKSKLTLNEFVQPNQSPLVLFDTYSFNWLRRLYYFAKKVSRQACQFGMSVLGYFRKIQDYYNNKELYLLKQQYEYEEELSTTDSDSLALLYPDYLFNCGISFSDYMKSIDSVVALNQIKTADELYYSNKRTHFKNAYLDSLALKQESLYLFNLIKNYLYGKKCNETIETFAS